MPLTLADAAWGFVTPAILAGITMVLLRRYLPIDWAGRYPAPIAATAGFLAGYTLLALGSWQATLHWHWLPYIVLAATVVGAVALAGGVQLLERWLLYGLVAVLAAWLLVPEWEDLEPSWHLWTVAMTIYVTLLAALIQPLAARVPGPLIGTVLSLCMVVVAVILALSGSLRMAQIAGTAAGGLVGCTTASVLQSRRGDFAGIALPFAVLAAGLMLIGRVNSYSSVPLVSYLLPPLAPLGLYCAATAGMSRQPGRTRAILATILVMLPLAIAVALASAAEMGGADDY